jgi:hypothetical protein
LTSNSGKKEKILFYLNSNFVNFGIAKFLQEKYDCEIYAIIDCNSNLKKFFQNQKIVQFKKSWYLRDIVEKHNAKFELNSLEKFESDYNINLWQVILADRFFYNHNEYYKFSHIEILNILFNEIKLYELIVDDIKPDFAVIKGTDLQQNDLLQKFCLAKKIPVLTLYAARFGKRSIISENFDELDDYELKSPSNTRTLSELQHYISGYSKQITQRLSTKGLPTSGLPTFVTRLKISLKYLQLIKTDSKSFCYIGRTFPKIVYKNISFFLKMYVRKSFLKKNSLKKIDSTHPYIYFPLHLEPERILSIGAPYYENQLEVIRHIAKSIPINYKLYVKEHPATSNHGFHSVKYYKKILELPNTELISFSIPNFELIKNSKLIICIAGSTGLEASFFQKPVITLSDVIYSILPSVTRLQKIEALPETIRNSLSKKPSITELNNFVNLIEQNSFDFDIMKLWEDSFTDLWTNGVLDVELNEEKMNYHLKKNETKYKKLVEEHIKKIQFFHNLK